MKSSPSVIAGGKPGNADLLEIEQIYANAPIGLALLDEQLRFQRINQRLAEANGLPIADHIGRTVREIIPDAADQAEEIRDGFSSGGGPVTKLFSGTTQAQPGVLRHWVEHWSPVRDSGGNLIALNVAVEEVTAEKQQQEKRELLSRELRHRLKNTLSVVQAIARNTFKHQAEDDLLRFEQRIDALAGANRLLATSDWQKATVVDVVQAWAATAPRNRVSIGGEVANLGPDGAMSLALLLHELGTNARKYGSLSTREGTVNIHWTITGGQVRLEWKESGGPAVHEPDDHGFGFELLERLLAFSSARHGGLEFQPDGVRCTIFIDLPNQDPI